MNSEQDRVFLVDDDPCDLELFQRAVAMNDINALILSARDGIEALEQLSSLQDHQLPKLLIVDYKMPRMGGIRLLEELHHVERFRHIPVVILTSSKDRKDIDRAYAAGANAYMVKPVSFTEFSRDIKTMLSFWLSLNQTGQNDLPKTTT